MPMRSCVLFDFDGVLVDSEWLAFCQTQTLMAERYGVRLQREDCYRYIGGTEEQMARSLVERFALPVTPQALLAELSGSNTLYESDALTLMPGARDFLLRLRRQGVRTGLVSSTASRHILSTANRLGLVSLMDVILCGDMVHRHKPDPEGYRTAMALLHAAPEECVILEDSPVGLQAARAAGAFTVGLCQSQLRQDVSAADLRAASYAELCSPAVWARLDLPAGPESDG